MKRTQFKQEKHIQKIIVVLSIILILIAVAITAVYLTKTQKAVSEPPKISKVSKQRPSASKKIKNLTLKQVVGLVVIYMHKIDNQDSDWRKVYYLGKHDGLLIKKYRQYHFKDFNLTAQKNNLVYVINDRVAFEVNSNQINFNSKLLMADSKEKLTQVNIDKMYHSLDSSDRVDWQNISNNLDIAAKLSKQSNNLKIANLRLITIPKQLRGTWYYYNNIQDKQVMEKIVITGHLVRNSMIFDSQEIDKYYRRGKGNKNLHELQNKYPNALEGKIINKNKNIGLLIYDLLDKQKAREELFVKRHILYIKSGGKLIAAYPTTKSLIKKYLRKNIKFDNNDEDLDLFID
ncbi:hypothetical protein J2Z60_001129 [Lactobacillus colini]|uniref:Uncharacterized protein n=1 Tax=Lactobacillus colini TaxID=1819254 RepID=A0ABS4ME31_9LACO|nr:hypothetical protein [Lactobacillus colini]MBP2057954.1 hypothetical protein [Lactobacillus colini]